MSHDTSRKRRRWLIVGLLLAGVSLGAWWFWPRIDERLVGKWHGSHPNALPPFERSLELLADGTGRRSEIIFDDFDDEKPQVVDRAICWWVDGNNLYIQWLSGNAPGPVGRLWSIFNARISVKYNHFRVREITDRRIVYHWTWASPDTAGMVLDRVE